ncbi:hypothetical protein [Heyndrickxia sporothermodurans]|uniref:hypothetical protein n=1 Tax=Heyndrickxia sporothermodurans TaxID=46224 RepID=UPI000D369DCA|nr:hypothetical protein [Heyndrickxia sporothermodurans]PTY93046.1 hypothetical protein B5V90_02885 [Heyndrickxia sporothermodurans]
MIHDPLKLMNMSDDEVQEALLEDTYNNKANLRELARRLLKSAKEFKKAFQYEHTLNNKRDFWGFIERAAQKQEDVDDSWKLVMVDTLSPMYSGRADYKLMNVVTHEKREGYIDSWGMLMEGRE